MIPCPGCGAGMRFDIQSQALTCDYCGETMDVSAARSTGTARQDEWDLNAFICPQCAGTIYSTDNQAASFCFFCGASVELGGRLESVKKPVRIIPFQKTKEECKSLYQNLARKAFFAPKELRSPEFLDRFQGIYLPFWTYSIVQKGPVCLTGKRENGDYTEHVSTTFDLDVEYDGISYDASSAFNDELCSWITPFHRDKMKDFSPAYVSGFYADIADVDSYVYQEDALEAANQETISGLKSRFGDVSYDLPQDKSHLLHTRLTDTAASLCPVWFLTWRKDDRVAYAIVNGETGKIAADFPVDQKRFFLGTLLLAVPLFLLLCAFPVITAPTMILIASALSIAVSLLVFMENQTIKWREERSADKGYQYRLAREKVQGQSTKRALSHPESSPGGAARFVSAGIRGGLPLAAGFVGVLIRLVNPASDMAYYSGAILILVCCCLGFIGLVRRLNDLTTRPIPEFHGRKEGTLNVR